MSVLSRPLIFSQPKVNVTLLIQAIPVHPCESLGKQALQGAPEVSKTGAVRQLKYQSRSFQNVCGLTTNHIYSRPLNMRCK